MHARKIIVIINIYKSISTHIDHILAFLQVLITEEVFSSYCLLIKRYHYTVNNKS